MYLSFRMGKGIFRPARRAAVTFEDNECDFLCVGKKPHLVGRSTSYAPLHTSVPKTRVGWLFTYSITVPRSAEGITVSLQWP